MRGGSRRFSSAETCANVGTWRGGVGFGFGVGFGVGFRVGFRVWGGVWGLGWCTGWGLDLGFRVAFVMRARGGLGVVWGGFCRFTCAVCKGSSMRPQPNASNAVSRTSPRSTHVCATISPLSRLSVRSCLIIG